MTIYEYECYPCNRDRRRKISTDEEAEICAVCGKDLKLVKKYGFDDCYRVEEGKQP